MGRYADKIKIHFSTDKSRPTFQETVFTAQTMSIKNMLEKMNEKERNELISFCKEKGTII